MMRRESRPGRWPDWLDVLLAVPLGRLDAVAVAIEDAPDAVRPYLMREPRATSVAREPCEGPRRQLEVRRSQLPHLVGPLGVLRLQRRISAYVASCSARLDASMLP